MVIKMKRILFFPEFPEIIHSVDPVSIILDCFQCFFWAAVSCKFATSSGRKLMFLPWTSVPIVAYIAGARVAALLPPPLLGSILCCKMMSFDGSNEGVICRGRQNQNTLFLFLT
jgi:hypothetical protein